MVLDSTDRSRTSRQRLLVAAAAELVATGGLQVVDVARRAGVSVGLPYRYFPTRDALLVAVLVDFYDRLRVAALGRVYPEPTWAERERQRIADWVDTLYADPLSPLALAGLVGDGTVAATAQRLLRDLVDSGSRNIAAAQRAGDLPTGRDPQLLAAAALGGVQQAVAVALERDPPPPADQLAADLWVLVAGLVGLPAAVPTGSPPQLATGRMTRRHDRTGAAHGSEQQDR